jgi:cysteine-rich repeat protein
MKFGGPSSMFVIFADDNQQELSMQGPGAAFGSWTFANNSDGGILGGFPFPGDWSLDLSPSFSQNISSWAFVDGSGNFFELGTNGIVSIQSRSSSQGLCRQDCTAPTCGDGRLDAGEDCDSGPFFPGSGCKPDCKLGFLTPVLAGRVPRTIRGAAGTHQVP